MSTRYAQGNVRFVTAVDVADVVENIGPPQAGLMGLAGLTND